MFVDQEQCLNSAVQDLRSALADSAWEFAGALSRHHKSSFSRNAALSEATMSAIGVVDFMMSTLKEASRSCDLVKWDNSICCNACSSGVYRTHSNLECKQTSATMQISFHMFHDTII